MATGPGIPTGKVTLPPLPYAFEALEPYLSREIMELHHQRHHKGYVNNFNKALDELQVAVQNKDTFKFVSLQSSIKFNGGGHINHSIFWKNLAPTKEGGGVPPQGKLRDAINKDFGSLEALIKKINAEGTLVQGSGWVWLGYDTDLKRLVVETTPNQDPLVTKGMSLVPLLGIDVWEHAFYLQYKNLKGEYLSNIWNVMNWSYSSQVFEEVAP